MTDTLLKEMLNHEPFTWDVERINVEDEVRDLYLKALRQADNLDYSALLDFVRADWEKRGSGDRGSGRFRGRVT